MDFADYFEKKFNHPVFPHFAKPRLYEDATRFICKSAAGFLFKLSGVFLKFLLNNFTVTFRDLSEIVLCLTRFHQNFNVFQ